MSTLNKLSGLFSIILLFSLSASAFADPTTYTLQFDKKSKKQPELQNVTIKGQLFKHGSPFQRFEVKTNSSGEITFDKDFGSGLSAGVYYIEGQEKLKAKCSGYALPNKKDLKVLCE